jgi:hypothetical protein
VIARCEFFPLLLTHYTLAGPNSSKSPHSAKQPVTAGAVRPNPVKRTIGILLKCLLRHIAEGEQGCVTRQGGRALCSFQFSVELNFLSS